MSAESTSARAGPRSVEASEAGPSARRTARPVAVFLSRFPVITETFILREIMEMERQGVPVTLVPLIREDPEVVHREALPWIERALFRPLLSRTSIVSNLRTLVRRPRRYSRLVWRILATSAVRPRKLLGSLNAFVKAVDLARELRARGIAHLHAQFATHPTTAALVVSELAGIPFSFTAHAHDIFVPWRRAMLEEKLRRASFVRVISSFNRKFLLDLYGRGAEGGLEEKIRVIHVGVPPEDYATPDPGPRDPCPRTDSGGVRLLCVAAMKPYKGIEVLVEAARRMIETGIDLHLDLVGTGPLASRVRRSIEDAGAGDRIHMLGALPQHDVTHLLARSDALVLPSIVARDGQMEGIPVALMEALASGRPVVASALSGIPELVTHEVHGLLVPPGDADALAEALGRIAEDPALRTRLGEAGPRRIASSFSLASCTGELIDAIAENTPPLPEELERGTALYEKTVGAPPAVIGRVREGRDAVVAILGDADRRTLVCKIHRDRPGQSRPPTERARREWEMLRRLDDRLPGPFGVPGPVELDPAGAAVLMEPARGLPGDAWLRRLRFRLGTADRRRLDGIQRLCGAWLAELQRVIPVEGDAMAILEARIDRRLAALEACELPSGLASGVREKISRLRDWLRIDSLEIRACHGDLWPGNFWIDPGEPRVEGIDFEGWEPGPAWEDVGRYLVHLELYLSYPGLGRRCRRLTTRFLEGWAGDDDWDPAAVGLGRILAAIDLLACREGGSGLGGTRRRRILRRILRQG